MSKLDIIGGFRMEEFYIMMAVYISVIIGLAILFYWIELRKQKKREVETSRGKKIWIMTKWILIVSIVITVGIFLSVGACIASFGVAGPTPEKFIK